MEISAQFGWNSNPHKIGLIFQKIWVIWSLSIGKIPGIGSLIRPLIYYINYFLISHMCSVHSVAIMQMRKSTFISLDFCYNKKMAPLQKSYFGALE